MGERRQAHLVERPERRRWYNPQGPYATAFGNGPLQYIDI
jgi:hypothetical protein